MSKRDFQTYEPKWQKAWEEKGVYHAQDDADQADKFFGLIEFPFPSGEGLHVGHPRSFVAIDVMTRKLRMEGKNVLYPIGWDAFGLPTENFAIKTKQQPQVVTTKNIANYKRQIQSLGIGFDWSREINTTDPKYYKWTQWQFLKFFDSWYDEEAERARPIAELPIPVILTDAEARRAFIDSHRMAYKAKTLINWCPKDKIGLANEEVVDGKCERCGTVVEEREKEQWMIRITKYADRLLKDLDQVDYLDKIKAQQSNWIGKSEGAYVVFDIDGIDEALRVFTTRPDTLFGVTFAVLAPEHPLVSRITHHASRNPVTAYIKEAKQSSDEERGSTDREKTGVFTGAFAINPANGKRVPIWIADYVMMGYGTGAIMAVPGHDERDFAFAKKYDLPVVTVVADTLPPPLTPPPGGGESELSPSRRGRWRGWEPRSEEEGEGALVSDGFAINSDFLDGLPTWKAKDDMISWLEENGDGERAVTYRLRDWVFSRQRYWGEPIPLVQCGQCGWVPVPEGQLPVELPVVEAYEPTDSGESPLAKMRDWVETTCPVCGGPAERETDTMPNWAGSSWYFLRYADPHNDHAFASKEKLAYWLPVDLYNGGMEHTTLHLLYSRFWYKFLWDLGLIPEECGSEPYRARRSHGMVLAEGGEKMSKSRGNVINPDDIVSQYGADVLRLYEMFIGPFDQAVPWDTNGIEGVRRFLDKVCALFLPLSEGEVEGVGANQGSNHPQPLLRKEGSLVTLYHQTVKKITEGIEHMQFNTSVSALMILTNAYQDAGGVPEDQREGFLKILAPFAPHLAEELWQEVLGHKETIHREPWPSFDATKLESDTFELVVQVNGKVRARLTVATNIAEEEAKRLALDEPVVAKWLESQAPKKVIYIAKKLVNIVM
ncbi:MAG: leucine--tRNA ligase [Patescibacteria group bacterium]